MTAMKNAIKLVNCKTEGSHARTSGEGDPPEEYRINRDQQNDLSVRCHLCFVETKQKKIF